MTRRPPSLRRLAILLTLPVLVVAGMGLWVIVAERERAENERMKVAARMLELLKEEVVFHGTADAIETMTATFEPWQHSGADFPAAPVEYAVMVQAREECRRGGRAQALARLKNLSVSADLGRGATPTGLPFLPVLRRVWLDADPGPESAERLCLAAVQRPSVLTLSLVQDALPFLPETMRERWLGQAQRVDALVRGLASGSLPHEWHREVVPGGALRCTHRQSVIDAVLTREFALRGWPQPFAPAVNWHWFHIIQPPAGSRLLASSAVGPWTLAVVQSPGGEDASQRARFLTGIMAGVVLVVAVAMWLTYRGFKKQAALARMQAEFVASVSHELRTPVAGIGALAERLESGTADAAQTAEYHRMIAREGRRLAALVDNVLDFSRIERGAKAYDLDHADLPRLIRETAALLRPMAEEKGLALVEDIADVPEDRWPAVDAVAIRQALVNLLDNAIKFTPAGGTVTVGLSQSGQSGQISIFVRDTGIGIPAAEQARIFEKFYRVDNGLRRETTGAGIGLSIVKHIAEAHEARVVVESEPGKGAVFVLRFGVSESRK